MKFKNLLVSLLAMIGIVSISTAAPLLDNAKIDAPLTYTLAPVALRLDDGPAAQSVIPEWKEGSIGLTYINDGIDGLAGLTARVWQINDKFRLNGVLVSDFKSDAHYYAGVLFVYRAYESKSGIKLDLGIGAKGIDISNGFDKIVWADRQPLIWSIGVSFPIK